MFLRYFNFSLIIYYSFEPFSMKFQPFPEDMDLSVFVDSILLYGRFFHGVILYFEITAFFRYYSLNAKIIFTYISSILSLVLYFCWCNFAVFTFLLSILQFLFEVPFGFLAILSCIFKIICSFWWILFILYFEGITFFVNIIHYFWRSFGWGYSLLLRWFLTFVSILCNVFWEINVFCQNYNVIFEVFLNFNQYYISSVMFISRYYSVTIWNLVFKVIFRIWQTLYLKINTILLAKNQVIQNYLKNIAQHGQENVKNYPKLTVIVR